MFSRNKTAGHLGKAFARGVSQAGGFVSHQQVENEGSEHAASEALAAGLVYATTENGVSGFRTNIPVQSEQ